MSFRKSNIRVSEFLHKSEGEGGGILRGGGEEGGIIDGRFAVGGVGDGADDGAVGGVDEGDVGDRCALHLAGGRREVSRKSRFILFRCDKFIARSDSAYSRGKTKLACGGEEDLASAERGFKINFIDA